MSRHSSDAGRALAHGAILFSVSAPVRGTLDTWGEHIFATVSEFPLAHGEVAPGTVDDIRMEGRVGIAAFDKTTGTLAWQVRGVPPLATVVSKSGLVLAYGRSGVVVALGPDGREVWRTTVPDDRSAPGRARGDAEAPFVADVLVDHDALILAAGGEVLRLSQADGAVLARATVCRGPGAVIARLALDPRGYITATCTTRTEFDDERAQLDQLMWQPRQTLEQRRASLGDVVRLRPDLGELWRVPPPENLFAGNRAPVPAPDGGVVLVGWGAEKDGGGNYVPSSVASVIAFLDGSTGSVRWHRPLGGRGGYDPLALSGGILAGEEEDLYSYRDGSLVWQTDDSSSANQPRAWHGAVVDLYEHGVVAATETATGKRHTLALFSKDPARSHLSDLTTRFQIADDVLYVGLREAGEPIQLRAIALPRELSPASSPLHGN